MLFDRTENQLLYLKSIYTLANILYVLLVWPHSPH